MLKSRLEAWGAVILGSAAAAYATRGRSSSLFGPSVWRGSRDHRSVALTFDDGPHERTPELLEILAKSGAAATFFQCGAHVDRLPAIAAEVARAGHEIGNHSHTHAKFCFHSPAFVLRDFARAQEAIERAAGFTPKLMRAPYGVRWFGFAAMQRQTGLLGVMWTVIARDWRLPAEGIVERVLRRVSNGGIICLHDGRGLRVKPDIRSTLDAVRIIVPRLQQQGYRFETVSQLLCPTNS